MSIEISVILAAETVDAALFYYGDPGPAGPVPGGMALNRERCC